MNSDKATQRIPETLGFSQLSCGNALIRESLGEADVVRERFVARPKALFRRSREERRRADDVASRRKNSGPFPKGIP
jgi:hypothetical protein